MSMRGIELLMRSNRKPTLADVALRAGVSAATVSRFCKKPYMVSEEARTRVQQAIAELGYQPSSSASPRSNDTSRNIGVVVPTLEIPTFATGVSALHARLSESEFMLQLAISNFSPRQEINCVRELIRSGVAGLVLVGTSHEPAVFEMLDRARIPFVNIWDFIESDPRPCIGFDNRQAGRHIANYILSAGHREIAVMAGGGPQRSDRSVARAEGTLSALRDAGIELPGNRIIELPYIMQAGAAAVRSFLELKSPPTAIICTNDILAVGALLESQRLGIRVPDELSFTGFDDLEISSL
ncbi:LacI family DNA-binding transcriptional regulator, partial [Devosia sp.]|uniref:LacI family DNA-binding transcriptional regulator n=1 Tax=Devosia sp. TaxID=1871048 RepID=UPI002F24C41E